MPNVYDFDETIVYPNAGIEFIKFIMRRHPQLRLYLPRMGREAVHYRIFHKRPKPFKAEFYVFMRSLPEWEKEVELFWKIYAGSMLRPWYLERKQPDDIIISDSADFLLRPICERLGVRLVATRVNTATGRLIGPDCYGLEKLRRLREEFGEVEIEEFYSDSLYDEPLAKMAKRAWLVNRDELTPWPFS